MGTHDILLISKIAIFFGILFLPIGSPADQERLNGAATICESAARGLVEGQRLRVVATYKTDSSHYSYLFSDGCGRDGVWNIMNVTPIPPGSVKVFFDAKEQYCRDLDNLYLCVIKVKLDADIKIVRDWNGRFAAELVEVHDFSFSTTETGGNHPSERSPIPGPSMSWE